MNGAPSRTRTCGLLIRSQTLYPTELWVHIKKALGTLIFVLSSCAYLHGHQSTKIKAQKSSRLFRRRRDPTLELVSNETDHVVDLFGLQLLSKSRHSIATLGDLFHEI